jgi:hypothetical protein
MADHSSNAMVPVDYSQSVRGVYEDAIVAHNLSRSESDGDSVDLVCLSGLVRQILSRESTSKPKRLKWFGAQNDPDTYFYSGCGDEKEYICREDASGNITANLAMLDAGRRLTNWAISRVFWPHPTPKSTWRATAPESIDTWVDGAAHSGIDNIRVRGILSGQVEQIGPSYSDFIAHPDASQRWAAELSRFYDNSTELNRARGQYERLKALINTATDITARNIVPLEDHSNQSESPRLFIGSDFMMGLVPSNAQVGDVICQFWNSPASAVLRRSANGHLVVAGRSAVIAGGNQLRWDTPMDRSDFDLDGGNVVDLSLGMSQLTRLSLDTVLLPGTADPDEDSYPL